jgi:hypothetical protein
MFGNGNSGGWHADAGSESGNQYLYSPDYQFGKLGLYLQDNTINFGGGIDVVPETHKAYRYMNGMRVFQKINAGFVAFSRKFKKLSVPLKSGDAVFFDSRLVHRSSPPTSIQLTSLEASAQRVSYEKINPQNAKYVFYWNAGSEKDANHFLRNSCMRSMNEEMFAAEGKGELFYSNYLRYTYPDDFPDEYKEAVDRSSRIVIDSLDANKSVLFKSLINS